MRIVVIIIGALFLAGFLGGPSTPRQLSVLECSELLSRAEKYERAKAQASVLASTIESLPWDVRDSSVLRIPSGKSSTTLTADAWMSNMVNFITVNSGATAGAIAIKRCK